MTSFPLFNENIYILQKKILYKEYFFLTVFKIIFSYE